MPYVKCRYYTESGEPCNGGCRRKGVGCTFVHPDEPGWGKAPPAGLGAKGRGGDSGSFRSGGKRGRGRGASGFAARDTGEKSSGILGGQSDTAGSWNTGGSGWDTGGSGWDTGGSGWDTGGSGWDTGGSGWGKGGSGSDKGWDKGGSGWDTGPGDGGGRDASGWGSPLGGGWGEGWGNPRGDAGDGWGGGWGDAKDTDKSSENKEKETGGWGSTPATVTSWGDGDAWGTFSNPIAVENDKENPSESNKAMLPPPRVPLPGNEASHPKITGTNRVPIANKRWGEGSSQSKPTPKLDTNIPAAMEIDSPGAQSKTPLSVVHSQLQSARSSDRGARGSDTPTASTPGDSSRRKRKHDAAFEDKFNLFKEYVKAWERGVRTRFMLVEAEAKRDRWFRTQKSACYARIGEAGRQMLDAQRAECDKDVNIQREKHSSAITSLVEFHDAITSNLDLGQRYNISEEASRFVTQSKAFVHEVRSFFVVHGSKDNNDEKQGLSPTEYDASTPNEFQTLLHQVRDLEERFEEAQTELTLRHPRDIRCEIDEKLNTTIAALRAARQSELERIASQPRPEIVIPPVALQKMEETARQVRKLDADMPPMVEDIRVLLLQVGAATKRVYSLEEEIAANKETYRKMQAKAAAIEETKRRSDEQLKKIQEQFEQLTASEPSRLATESFPSVSTYTPQDMSMRSLRPAFEALLEKFYEREVRPTVQALGEAAIEASDRHQQEIMSDLWGKMQPAMNMVEGVSRWLDSQELGLTDGLADVAPVT
ncbi:hypothetical protein BDN67DRAFT_620500 [Paxillus ammoniavirescens]|nr:hypothetical protein BDN67DRAFT_620500 [Paxillus ammoniavirescens]